jgi:NTE family protein
VLEPEAKWLAKPAGEEPCGLALCLSGGGYRAMLFHLGALWRLNQLGYLGKLDRVSSVSGGSIAAGVLAKHWDSLQFDANGTASNFEQTVVPDLHGLANRTVDAPAILGGLFWFGSIGNRVAGAYKRHLFGSLKLSDLPDKPRFVFNATNLQTGSLWRFSKPYMADYKVGQVLDPDVELATAVAASSAFPPFLSPVKLKLDEGAIVPFDSHTPELHKEPYTRKVVLSDGGVYDNLGLETALGRCDVLLVSDGGGKLKPAKRPWRNWPMHTLRVLGVIDSQVRALRARDLVDGFDARRERGESGGALWAIRTPIASYELPDALPAPKSQADVLAATKTRLGKLPEERQQQLVNWGYAVSDAALRRYMGPGSAPEFPYPDAGIG